MNETNNKTKNPHYVPVMYLKNCGVIPTTGKKKKPDEQRFTKTIRLCRSCHGVLHKKEFPNPLWEERLEKLEEESA